MTYELTDLHELGLIDVDVRNPPVAFFDAFENQLHLIREYWALDPDDPYYDSNSSPKHNPTIMNVQALIEHVQTLIGWMQNGYVVNGITYYAKEDMARHVEVLLKLFKAVGLDVTLDPTDGSLPWSEQVKAFQRWQATAEVGTMMTRSVETVYSLQRIVETDYVERGNRLIFEELEGLRIYMEQTKLALDVVTQIQNLHNMVEPVPLDPFDQATYLQAKWFDENGKELSGDKLNRAYTDWWNNYCEAHFDYVEVQPDYGPNGEAGAWATMMKQTVRINAIIVKLGELAGLNINPALTVEQQVAQIEQLFHNDEIEPGSLLEKLIQVEIELPKSQGDLEAWLIDGLNDREGLSGETRGAIDRHLGEALTAGSNLNDEQKAEMRSIMFVFEEFYKSATAILSKVSQIIEKMAANIAR